MMIDDDDDGDEDEISENDDDVGDDEEKEEEMKMKDEIVDKFIRNFHNGNYDVELDDKLSSDRGTIKTARPTQASYNISPIIGERGIDLDWRK